jgi:spore photoproduct lyase
MSKVSFVQRKSMEIKSSGRSTDFIGPSFGFGCLFDCSYCYCKRHVNDGVKVAKNIDDILKTINEHAYDHLHNGWHDNNKPNQTDDKFITYDIGCNEDLALHAKYYDIEKIFRTITVGYIKLSFATKYVNYDLPDIRSKWSFCINRIRIRFSLMPQKYSDILEPNTSLIIDRIKAIDKFIEKGYEVHINFSPVIVTDTWHQDYKDLFLLVDEHVSPENKDKVKSEVIFLTHNEKKHAYNLKHNLPGEDMLWRPELQEAKKSQYGGDNIRYIHTLKAQYVHEFRALHSLLINWNTIRYIF